MNREIKFRGKSIYSNEWVYGDHIHSKQFKGYSNEYRIHDKESGLESDINPETVGQYTGLKCKNGKEIYEGDIIQSDYRNRIFTIIWRRNGWALEWNKSYEYSTLYNRSVMVIGNIHDNPDLLSSKTS